MKCEFILNDFEGPLDLLLYLLKKENMKIEDIEIEKITEQYLEFINKMENINLDIASEYLIMAAELIEMKSYVLLPTREEIVEEDRREQLISRLNEYKLYKEITNELRLLEEDRKQIYTKVPSLLEEYKKEEVVADNADINILIEAFKNFLQRKEQDKKIDTKVATKEYSVSNRNKEIINILKLKKMIEFTELFDIMTKEYIIVTFLSVLDLAKKQEIEIIQDKNFNKIVIKNRVIK